MLTPSCPKQTPICKFFLKKGFSVVSILFLHTLLVFLKKTMEKRCKGFTLVLISFSLLLRTLFYYKISENKLIS
jgi:hypothetical protein